MNNGDRIMFKNKTLLITGGTGSFGNAVMKRFLATDIKEIRIFSRDEKKQDDMRKMYNNNKLKFYIGDVRDKESIRCVWQYKNTTFGNQKYNYQYQQDYFINELAIRKLLPVKTSMCE